MSEIISICAILVSLFTAWFTIFRRGSIKSTKPSFVAFRYDFVNKSHPQAKIFLRALLFSTGKRGHVIESLFLRVKEGARSEEFSFWGYGDKDLVRGSGLFVAENGIATNHHFNPLHSDKLFRFSPGVYELQLIATIVGKSTLIPLFKIKLPVHEDVFDGEISREKAVYFNWSPEKRSYVTSIEQR